MSEVDGRVKNLEKTVDEFVGAIRKLGEQQASIATMVSNLSNDVSNMKVALKKLGTSPTQSSISKYR